VYVLTFFCWNFTVISNNYIAAGAEVPHMFARSALVPGTGLMLPDTGLSPSMAAPAKSCLKKSHFLPIDPDQSKFDLRVVVICNTGNE
jgi:hypothetical protein